MLVLVTGGTGFLGGWVTRELLGAGYRVRILARRPPRSSEDDLSTVEVCEGDLFAPEPLARAASGVDAIVHCAGLVSLNLRDRGALQRTNVEATRVVLDLAMRHRIRMLHTSSIATIGPTAAPQALDESSAAVPLNFDYPYAMSKRQSESLALEYCQRGADVVVLNPGILFGPGDVKYTSTQFILRYLRRELWMHLPGGASFADVRDVARAYVAALERGRPGERYILAGINRRYQELQAELRRLTGLHGSAPLPQPVAEWFAFWSQLSATFWRHPFEELNTSVVRWASLFNYCSAARAESELGFRAREFSSTLVDTIVDHLRRGAARPSTAELRSLLHHAPVRDAELPS